MKIRLSGSPDLVQEWAKVFEDAFGLKGAALPQPKQLRRALLYLPGRPDGRRDGLSVATQGPGALKPSKKYRGRFS